MATVAQQFWTEVLDVRQPLNTEPRAKSRRKQQVLRVRTRRVRAVRRSW